MNPMDNGFLQHSIVVHVKIYNLNYLREWDHKVRLWYKLQILCINIYTCRFFLCKYMLEDNI